MLLLSPTNLLTQTQVWFPPLKGREDETLDALVTAELKSNDCKILIISYVGKFNITIAGVRNYTTAFGQMFSAKVTSVDDIGMKLAV